ncbi:unnamed protein product [Periconia digitata]|uniref:Uncharacterized protein n=1 Tax=Periconia digitata TaxID=1303443 RepID=A0A9W4UPU3_9PLEO|nr:unnamed protein product [Periconia digitata]
MNGNQRNSISKLPPEIMENDKGKLRGKQGKPSTNRPTSLRRCVSSRVRPFQELCSLICSHVAQRLLPLATTVNQFMVDQEGMKEFENMKRKLVGTDGRTWEEKGMGHRFVLSRARVYVRALQSPQKKRPKDGVGVLTTTRLASCQSVIMAFASIYPSVRPKTYQGVHEAVDDAIQRTIGLADQRESWNVT